MNRIDPIAPGLQLTVQHLGCEVREQCTPAIHIMLWVHSGSAEVRVGRHAHRLTAGQAICVPAGARHRVSTAPASVVFPLFLDAAATPSFPEQPIVIDVPPRFADWLVFHFEIATGVRPVGLDAAGLHTPLDHSRSPAAGALDAGDDLVMPRSPAAFEVARALRREPSLDTSVTAWAHHVGLGLRTMQTQFTDETGLTFSAWRTRNRVLHAARLLDAGHGPSWVAARVGFATPSGFIRAFNTVYSTTPGRYAARRANRPDRVQRAAQATTVLDALLAGNPAPLPPIPARTLPPLTNEYHVVLWAYRGSVQVRIGARSWRLRTDSLLFIPAGVRHVVHHQAGSILLVVDYRHGVAAGTEHDVAATSITPDLTPVLLYTSIANLTQLRPRDHDLTSLNRTLDAFTARRRQRSLTLPAIGPARDLALALNEHPGDRRTLAEWASVLRTDQAELGAAFAVETGLSFTRWRARLRMQVARELVCDGIPSTSIARTLGYAHPTAFTTAFRRAHGVPPRAFRQLHRRPA